jgi:hypothetical protein
MPFEASYISSPLRRASRLGTFSVNGFEFLSLVTKYSDTFVQRWAINSQRIQRVVIITHKFTNGLAFYRKRWKYHTHQ